MGQFHLLRLGTAALFCVVVCSGVGWAQTPSRSSRGASISVQNVLLNTAKDVAAAGDSFYFRVFELYEGVDLSGDGEVRQDDVVHVFDGLTGQVTNLGLVTEYSVVTDGNRAVILVNENDVGLDLTGDGDQLDLVPHVCESGSITVLGSMPARQPPSGSGNWPVPVIAGSLVVIAVCEDDKGADLNGDGDMTDVVPSVYDLDTQQVTNLGFAITETTFNGSFLLSDGDLVSVTAYEPDQGADMNGDGDLVDRVLMVYDHSTQQVTNLGLTLSFPSAFSVEGGFVHLVVGEPEQGMTDLNGDGDVTDDVLHSFEASTGTVTNVGLALSFSATRLRPALGRLLFGVSEEEHFGVDLNGDGDATDAVLHHRDAVTGTVSNLGLATGGSVGADAPLLSPDLGCFLVSETRQGTDLNGDLDTLDRVLHIFDPATDEVRNLEIALFRFPFLQGNLITANVSENDQAATDLNGDGDTDDEILHVYDAGTDRLHDLQIPYVAQLPLVTDVFVAFLVREDFVVMDLNGDGDQLDRALHVFDRTRCDLTNLGLQVGPDSLFARSRMDGSGVRIGFFIDEEAHGNQDLNNNGQVREGIFHVATLTPSAGSVTSVLPNSGSEGGDTHVNILGCGFTPDTTVELDGVAATVLEIRGDRVVVRTPAGTGVVDVTLSSPNGTVTITDGFTYLDPALASLLGNTNVGLGDRENVLFLNGSEGDGSRVVSVAPNSPIQLEVFAPSSRLDARYVLYGVAGEPSGASVTNPGFDLGLMCFALPGLGGSPLATWNLLGHVPVLGASDFNSQQAPTTIFNVPGLPNPLTVTFHGIIKDDEARIPLGFAVTNGVVLKVE